MNSFSEVNEKLKSFNQEHLLQHYDSLTAEQQTKFLNDLNKLDLKHLKEIRERSLQESQLHHKIDSLMHPVSDENKGSVVNGNSGQRTNWEREGLSCIADGKVGVLLLAGGQGTRLGVKYPKGMYQVGLQSGKSLYEVKANRIKRLQELAFKQTGKHGIIPWYIMTSEATMKQTKDFFAEHKFFGLNPSDVVFFEQFTLPCIDFDGKILLADKNKIACAPDGNGGLYKAMLHWEVVDDMERRGVEFTHALCVDNILAKIADPVFVGFCKTMNADCGAKVVEKSGPYEAVGVVCKVDGINQVVEYSEISSETASKVDKSGRLVFNAGNICNHFFTVQFLRKACKANNNLPHHIAKKKIPHVNLKGELITPQTPNGIKLEKFVFDVFRFSEQFVILEVAREDEFSPLKNADGATSCTPRHSRWALSSLHHRRIVQAGGIIVDENDKEVQPLTSTPSEGEYPVKCEISPLLSYDGEVTQGWAMPYIYAVKSCPTLRINMNKYPNWIKVTRDWVWVLEYPLFRL